MRDERNIPKDHRASQPASSKYRTAVGRVRDNGSIHDAGRDRAPRDVDDARRERETRVRQARLRTPSGQKHHGNPLARLVNDWFDRVVGAVSEGDLSGQEELYASGRTSRDFMWNSIGQAAWGMVFPLLTIVVTQLSGATDAGMFSFVFVIANLLYIIGTYGVRTYQVSDIDEYHSFADYQVSRFVTCAIMLLCGLIVCRVLGYADEMATMCIGIFVYKTIDALGEAYEGRLQQVDKLYLGGISLSLRSALAFLAYTIVLFITGNLGFAAIAMAIAAGASFILVTFPLTLFESHKSRSLNLRSIFSLLKELFPVFLAMFLYAVIDNLPKFVMQGASLPYDNQLYFNALYFPAMAILIIVQLIYRPLLVKMARLWADESRRRRFDLFIVAMMVVIVVITVIAALFMAWLGIPILSFLYGLDFSEFRQLAIIMIAAGGVTAAIDFLYQVITILRRQRAVLSLYLITFAFALLVLILMTTMMQLEGAVVGYLIVMAILLILLVREYVVQRMDFSHREKGR